MLTLQLETAQSNMSWTVPSVVVRDDDEVGSRDTLENLAPSPAQQDLPTCLNSNRLVLSRIFDNPPRLFLLPQLLTALL